MNSPQLYNLQKVVLGGNADGIAHCLVDGGEKKGQGREIIATETAITAMRATQCDIFLESMDECVGCMDGIREQYAFEERLRDQAARQLQEAHEHGLSEASTTFIRSQNIGEEGNRSAVENTPNSMDPPVLCGRPHDSLRDLCDGVVIPMDTTVPTSIDFVETRKGKSERSLVDVAAESERASERKTNIDAQIQECSICNDACDIGNLSCRSISTVQSARQLTFCRLPCCKTAEGNDNFKVCTACMLVLTMGTKFKESRVGRCPRCRTWLSVNSLNSTVAPMDVRTIESSGICQTCLEMKEILIAEDSVICDACFLGREAPLIYECEICLQPQTIHSVMYRSQLTATSVGSEMWPCNTCQKSTNWKIRFEQILLIPAGDIPEDWSDNSLEFARAQVQKARQGMKKLDVLGRDAQGKPSTDDGCILM
ncbi:hypothetical protein IV203_011904 [Nitzschia inconspicua]|uniref:Uncharacterized protein n=1 Tax=Nitzschia inconspicua TaxID=303405 RepID=A0A9K3KT71_9STRA|nr:hypothetical protein IV203_011904 [Nitzschia inconspicua]